MNRSDEAQAAAEALARFVNNTNPDTQTFIDTVLRQHPTLQQAIFRLMLDTIKAWALIKHYDLRNEQTVHLSQRIVEALGDDACVPTI
jgi:hypothetical protein